MARIAQLVLPGNPHHVTQLSNRRQRVFFKDVVYAHHLKLIAQCCVNAKTEPNVRLTGSEGQLNKSQFHNILAFHDIGKMAADGEIRNDGVRETQLDTDVLEFLVVNLGDHPSKSQGAPYQTGDDVGLIISAQAKQKIGLLRIGLAEHRRFGAVAVKKTTVDSFRQGIDNGLAFLHDDHRDRGLSASAPSALPAYRRL